MTKATGRGGYWAVLCCRPTSLPTLQPCFILVGLFPSPMPPQPASHRQSAHHTPYYFLEARPNGARAGLLVALRIRETWLFLVLDRRLSSRAAGCADGVEVVILVISADE